MQLWINKTVCPRGGRLNLEQPFFSHWDEACFLRCDWLAFAVSLIYFEQLGGLKWKSQRISCLKREMLFKLHFLFICCVVRSVLLCGLQSRVTQLPVDVLILLILPSCSPFKGMIRKILQLQRPCSASSESQGLHAENLIYFILALCLKMLVRATELQELSQGTSVCTLQSWKWSYRKGKWLA